MKNTFLTILILLISFVGFSQSNLVINENLESNDTELINELNINQAKLKSIKELIIKKNRLMEYILTNKDKFTDFQYHQEKSQISNLFYKKISKILSDDKVEKFKELENKFK